MSDSTPPGDDESSAEEEVAEEEVFDSKGRKVVSVNNFLDALGREEAEAASRFQAAAARIDGV